MKGTKRPEDVSRSARFVPSKEWIEAFNLQCTEELMRRAQQFPGQHHRDGAVDARELVQKVVFDTLRGALRWDPSVRTLEMHLCDAIRKRAQRERARAKRLPHASIDDTDADGESSVMAEADAQLLADAPEAAPDTVARAAETARALQSLASRKPLVLRLLDAFAAGAISKEDAMSLAKMTEAEYHNARRQLARLIDHLPEHLKPNRRILAKGA